jgi:23S rRNA (uracil1939-C5)-methyltransferase
MQAKSKQAVVRDAFQRIAKLDPALEWAGDPTLRVGYRTRASFHGDDGRWGFHEAKTRRVVPVESCPLCHERLNEALATLREMKLERPVELVVNPEGDEVLVWTKKDAPKLRKRFAAYNSRNDGHARHTFTFDGVPIVNGTFSQSSLLLNRVLVRIVHEAVESPSALLDLYCGNGNLSLGLDANIQVTGVDHNPHAVNAAERRQRGKYVVGGEADFLEAIEMGGWGVVLLDPPRAGAKAIAAGLARCGAGKIVYVSCDSATLARDAATLAKAGWAIGRCVVVDMFPNTSHVETVCVFERS